MITGTKESQDGSPRKRKRQSETAVIDGGSHEVQRSYVYGPKESHKIYLDAPSQSVTPKSKDWTKATVKLTSELIKSADECCLTCIHYGRECKGTELVSVKAKKGHSESRCKVCSSNNRVCYWLDPAQGIATYDDAKRVLGGYTCAGNTVAGRAKRAKLRLNEGQALPYKQAAAGANDITASTRAVRNGAEDGDQARQIDKTIASVAIEDIHLYEDDENAILYELDLTAEGFEGADWDEY